MPSLKRTVTIDRLAANRSAAPTGPRIVKRLASRDPDSKGLPGFGLALAHTDYKGLIGFGQSVDYFDKPFILCELLKICFWGNVKNSTKRGRNKKCFLTIEA